METLTINEYNLKDSDINEYSNKVRAILLIDDKILVSHYGGVVLLPGGSIDNSESDKEAIIRELKEETGIMYNIDELKEFICINYYQYNYPTREGKTINRLSNTKYYIGKYKGFDLDNVNRTEKEIIDNFTLELVKLDELLNKTLSDNPRKEFFDRENYEIVKRLEI